MDRPSCFTLCGRTETKYKDEVASVINDLFDTITGHKKTLTLDNGRLRRVWPKKNDIATLSQEEIDNEVLLLNLTTRKILKGLTLLEVFTGELLHLLLELSVPEKFPYRDFIIVGFFRRI
jgi:IS30 family transposase